MLLQPLPHTRQGFLVIDVVVAGELLCLLKLNPLTGKLTVEEKFIPALKNFLNPPPSAESTDHVTS